MSTEQFEGEEFEFVKASIDGGVALECWRAYWESTGRELLIEAIWQDEPRSFRVRTAVANVPFDLLEAFVAEARRWCPSLPGDGTPG